MVVEGMENLKFRDMFPRTFECGEASGYCGADFIVTVSRAFTPEEDKLFAWVVLQDSVTLNGVHHLSDGRDIIVFDRKFRDQTPAEAEKEHRDHLAYVISNLPRQHAATR